MLLLLMSLAGTIPVIICLLLLIIPKLFPAHYGLFLLKMSIFFFLVPFQILWLKVPNSIYIFIKQITNNFFGLKNNTYHTFYHHIQFRIARDSWIWIPRWLLVLAVLWFIFFIIFLSKQIMQYYRTTQMLMFYSKPIQNNSSKLFKLRTTKAIPTPYSFGFFHFQIILPEQVSDPDMKQMILKHESCHLRHLDSFFKVLCLLIICLHFYNPFAYLLLFLYDTFCELRCDEYVISSLSRDERFNYSKLLIELSAPPTPRTPAWHNSFSINNKVLKWRLNNIMKKKNYSRLNKLFFTIIFASIILSCSTTALAYTPFRSYPDTNQIAIGDEITQIFDDFQTSSAYSADPILLSDFSIYDAIFITESNSITYLNLNDYSNDASRALCNHAYESGRLTVHQKHNNGSCTVTIYKAEKCQKCQNIKNRQRISQTHYDKCPH